MLSEFLRTESARLKPGDTVLCFIPESGRFTAGYMLLEVEDAAGAPVAVPATSRPRSATAEAQATVDLLPDASTIAPPHDPEQAPAALAPLLTELASLWQDYRSRVWRTPLLRRIRTGRLQTADYVRWMSHWVPQVREGSLWMREGAASLTGEHAALAALIDVHAGEEQNDFRILHEDYLKAGGTEADITRLRRNPGGEALNAYLHGLLPLLRASLPLPPDAFRFLEYHGANDEHHLERWLMAVQMVMELDSAGTAPQAIVRTARHTAALYLMQFEHVLPEET
jgi:3-oxoacyl-[acyl-carrier-protein] synthase-3